MALPLANIFAGTDGTSISTANSGGASGDAFDVVTIGTNATTRYDTAQFASGTSSYEFATVDSASAFVSWSTSIGTYSTVYGRFYLRLSAAPGGNTSIFSTISTATARARIQITTARKLRILDAAAGTVWTSTAALAVDTWYRVEFHIVNHASAGVAQVKLFTGHSASVDEDSTSFTGLNFGGTADRIRFGCVVNAVNFPTTWMDEIQVNGTGFPGPSVNTVTGTAAASLSLTATAAGVPTVLGVAVKALTLDATASGVRTVNGAAVAALTLTATVVGTRTTAGSALGALALTATAAGVRTVNGATLATLSLTATAVGTRTVVATAVASLTLTATASGQSQQVVTGVAAAALTLTAGALGRASTPRRGGWGQLVALRRELNDLKPDNLAEVVLTEDRGWIG